MTIREHLDLLTKCVGFTINRMKYNDYKEDEAH